MCYIFVLLTKQKYNIYNTCKMKESVKNKNSVKTPINKRFNFSVNTVAEEKYLKSLTELLSSKRRGDWKLIGEMLNVTPSCVQTAFYRVYQKNHFDVVNALKKVIAKRQELINH